MDLNKELEINHRNLDNLSDNCASQAAKYQYYFEQWILAIKKENEYKDFLNYKENELKILKAQIFTIIKNKEKISDKTAESYTIQNSKVIKFENELRNLKQKLFEYEKNSGILKTFVKAFEQRKDMLKEICQNKRAEYFSEVNIKKEDSQEKIRQKLRKNN